MTRRAGQPGAGPRPRYRSAPARRAGCHGSDKYLTAVISSEIINNGAATDDDTTGGGWLGAFVSVASAILSSCLLDSRSFEHGLCVCPLTSSTNNYVGRSTLLMKFKNVSFMRTVNASHVLQFSYIIIIFIVLPPSQNISIC